MFSPRVIPVLLLKDECLVKSVQFGKYNYIGDPINAVRLFNDFRADELIFLDIEATKQGRLISLDFVRDVGEEAKMPFAVGGGIRSLEDIRKIVHAGAEKVVLCSIACENPSFVKAAADEFGSSTIVVCMDVKKKWLGKEQVWSNAGTKATGKSPVDFAKEMQQLGAGELIVQSIEKDGTMGGYDLPLIKIISEAVQIPVVALGGAGSYEDLTAAFKQGYATAMAAGSLFVYQGNKKGVLISYERF